MVERVIGCVVCVIIMAILAILAEYSRRTSIKKAFMDNWNKTMAECNAEQDSVWTAFKAHSIDNIYMGYPLYMKGVVESDIRALLYKYNIDKEDVNISYEESELSVIVHITYKEKENGKA